MLKKLAKYYFDILTSVSSNIGNQFIDLTKNLKYGLTTDLGIFNITLNRIINDDRITFKINRNRNINFLNDEVEEENENQNLKGIDLEGLKEKAASIIVNIFRKQEFDLYNRETVIGYPIVSGRINDKKFCAPLFFSKVKIEFDSHENKVTLIKDYEIPALNFQLIKYLIEEDEQIEIIRREILPDIVEDFDRNKVEMVLQKLSHLVDAFENIKRNDYSDFTSAINLMGNEGVNLTNAIVIFSTTRTNPYLIDDLLELIKLERGSSNSIANIFISEAIETNNFDNQGNDELDLNIQLFPLLSNKAQRLSAKKAENSRLLVIQGPPGTGKSQTIVNLVCHLVSKGKTVLITSHQNKALEVITKFMPKIDYFTMSLLKNDRESLNELRNKLESFHAYVSGVDLEVYMVSLENKWSILKNTYNEIAKLESRFKELRDLERNCFSKFKRYHDIKSFNIIAPNDKILDLDIEICFQLKDYYESLLKVKEFYKKYEGKRITNNKHIEGVISQLKVLYNVYDYTQTNIISNENIFNFCKNIVVSNSDLSDLVEKIDELISWTNSCSKQFIEVKNSLVGKQYEILKRNFLCKHLRNLPNLKTKIQNSIKILDNVNKIKSISSLPQRLSKDKINQAIEKGKKLSDNYKSFFKWYFSKDIRDSKNFFNQLGFDKIARDERYIKKIIAWTYFWNWKYKLVDNIVEFSHLGIPIIETSIEDDLEKISANINLVEKSIRLITLSNQIFQNDLYRNYNYISQFIDQMSTHAHIKSLEELLEKTKKYLEDLKEIIPLQDNTSLNIFSDEINIKKLIANIKNLSFSQDSENDFKSLELLIKKLELYNKIKNYEQRYLNYLPNTINVIRSKALANEKISAFENPENIVESYRLFNYIKNDLVENPDDTQEISKKIKELKREFQNRILEIINTQRIISLKKAEQNTESLFEINKLIQLLRKKRKTHSFVQLRNNINYKKILELFPCWVMSIDDVARIFPLEEALFDYLIVDEASQCNQAAVLHLAYRAKRMIVVGDSKQMKNPNTQFLSETVVNLCLSKNGLDKHPKSVFLNCRNSLLDLAIGCQDTSPVFLNEHFRCEPPIIDFSNNRFYNGQLRILTPIRHKRFSPCMEIKIVNGAYDSPDDTKINEKEAKAVVNELKRMAENGELIGDKDGHKLTVGILSLYRKQALFIQNLVYENFDQNFIKEHEIVISTVDGFQGDEKDVILYSFRYALNSRPGMITVLQRDDEHSMGRLNVAFSRAKRKVICFISIPIESFPEGIIKDYLRHIKSIQDSNYSRLGLPGQREKCQSEFERDVFDALVKQGLEVYTQVPCSGFFIDLVVYDKHGRRLAIECDGYFHYEDDGMLREDDLQRQDIIERCGWHVHRIPSRKFYANPDKEIKKVIEILNYQEKDFEIVNSLQKNINIQLSDNNNLQNKVKENQQLSDEETKILKLIFSNGKLYVWQIVQYMNKDRDDIIYILRNLREKDLVMKSKDEKGIDIWEINPEKMDELDNIFSDS